jgi:hypothetical protein
MLGWALAITTAVALLGLLLRWAARPPDPAAIATWAASYNLQLHPDEQVYVSNQLRRGRLLRTLGCVIPLVVGQGAMVWWGLVHARPLPAPLSLLAFPSAWAAGYLLGAVAAELTRPRPHPRPVRAAMLAPRRLSDYLPAWMLWAERAVALAVLALVPLATPGSAGRAKVTVIAAITVATLVAVGLRAMVRRPQPLGGPGELAVDDALRSTALHRAAGAGLAALLFLLGNQLAVLDRHWWVLTGVLGLVCYGLAIGCWKDLTSPLWWPIRRGTGPAPPPPIPSPRAPGRGPA